MTLTAHRGPFALLALVLAAALSACGGGSASANVETAAAARPPDPVALLPADVGLVARFDVGRLRNSAYYETVKGMVRDVVANAGDRSDAEAFDALLARTDLVVLAVFDPPAQGGRPSTIAILRGRFGEGELEQTVRRNAAARARAAGTQPFQIVRENRRGQSVLVLEEDMRAAELATHTWMFADGAHIDGVLARAGGHGGATPRSSQAFQAMASRIRFDDGDITVVGEVTDAGRRQLARGMPPEEAAMLESLRSFGARVEAQRGMRLEAVARTSDPQVAARIAAAVGAQIENAANHVFVRMLGLGNILASTQVRGEGADAVLRMQANDDEVRQLIAQLGAFLPMAAQSLMGGGGGGAAAYEGELAP